MHKLLVIDDDQDICRLLTAFLGKKGYQVSSASRGATAVELLKENKFDAILCDHRLPDTDSLKMLDQIRTLNPEAATIIITGYSDVRVAVELIRRGAFDYVVKPLYPDEILLRLQEAVESRADKALRAAPGNGSTRLKSTTAAADPSYVVGTGAHAETIARHISLVAPTEMTVLITGETGTGKEYVAKEIHRQSKRANKPFVAVDCGALPKDLAGSELFGHVKGAFTGAVADKVGSFVSANGGTIFLDEIGNLTYENQVKLLRALQERMVKRVGDEKEIPVDVRVLAATNEDLRLAAAEGRFREDLYHRIDEFSIELLPLRERKDDIILFAEHFLRLAVEQLKKPVSGFDEKVLDHFLAHPWPGNLRELNNVIKRAVLLSKNDRIGMASMPTNLVVVSSPHHASPTIASPDERDGLRGAAQKAEREAIMAALHRVGFNRTRAAEALNIDRKTLYNKLKALGIDI